MIAAQQLMPPQLSAANRHKIVILHKDLHLSLHQIARRVGCSYHTVQHTLQRYAATGEVTDRPRSGRPSVMNFSSLKRLNRLIRSRPSATATSLATALTAHTGQRISPRTIQRARTHSLGFHPVHQIIVQSLTQGAKTKRLNYATTHLNSDFHNILFSDEKQFVLQNTGEVVWIKEGEANPTREVNQMKASVMVWGCVWFWGKSELYTTRSTINAQHYTNILASHLLPSMPTSSRFQFMHDNAAPHKAAYTRNWLVNFGVNVLPDYPPYSPELNPIEHVWSWMAAFVNGEGPTDQRSLERAVELAWQEIPQSRIQACIEHLPAVCRQVIDAGGDHI
jgi:transposase